MVENRAHEGHGGSIAALEDVLPGTSLRVRVPGVEGDGIEAGPEVCCGQHESFDKACGSELAGDTLEEARRPGGLIEERQVAEEINDVAAWQRRVFEHVESRGATREVKEKARCFSYLIHSQ